MSIGLRRKEGMCIDISDSAWQFRFERRMGKVRRGKRRRRSVLCSPPARRFRNIFCVLSLSGVLVIFFQCTKDRSMYEKVDPYVRDPFDFRKGQGPNAVVACFCDVTSLEAQVCLVSIHCGFDPNRPSAQPCRKFAFCCTAFAAGGCDGVVSRGAVRVRFLWQFWAAGVITVFSLRVTESFIVP